MRKGFLTPGAVPCFWYIYLGLSRILDVHFVRCIIIHCCTASLAMEENHGGRGSRYSGPGGGSFHRHVPRQSPALWFTCKHHFQCLLIRFFSPDPMFAYCVLFLSVCIICLVPTQFSVHSSIVSYNFILIVPSLGKLQLTRNHAHHHQDITAQGTIIVLAFDLQQNL